MRINRMNRLQSKDNFISNEFQSTTFINKLEADAVDLNID